MPTNPIDTPGLQRSWGQDLKARVREAGFAFIGQCLPNLDTRDFAELLGVPDDIPELPAVQELTPKTAAESAPNLYSGHFGYGAFPLHTDLAHWFMPPRYLLLRCRRGDERVGTSVMAFQAALRGVSSTVIHRARFRPRRALKGRVQLVPFLQRAADVVFYRWDSLFLRPDNADGVALAEHFRSLAQNEYGQRMVLRHSGDTLIIDNWRVLHGRDRVPDDAVTRSVERAYLRELKDDG